MNHLKKTITFILTLFVFNVAFSQNEQSHRLDDIYKECCNKKHGDYGALSCAIDVSKEWNNEINKYYKGLMNVLDSNAQNDLKQAQEQWLTYRDLEYKFSESLHNMDGTMYSRMRVQRNMEISRTRALELKSYYWTRTEEDEPKDYESKTGQIETQQNKTDTILPTPDEAFFDGLDSSNVDAILEKYMEYYKIKNVYTDNVDGSYTYQLKGYPLEEVKSVLKMLLTVDDDLETGWNDGVYNYLGMCNLEIYVVKNTIIIDFGCSC